MRSTTELKQQQRSARVSSRQRGAENGAQTRDPQLGRLVLYQLSYFRKKTAGRFFATVLAASNCKSKLLFNLLKTSALLTPSFTCCGRGWIRTTEALTQQIYSLPHLATLEHAQTISILSRASCRTRTNDLEITNHVLYQLS